MILLIHNILSIMITLIVLEHQLVHVSYQRQSSRSVQLERQPVVRSFGHIVKAHVAQEQHKQQFEDHVEERRGSQEVRKSTGIPCRYIAVLYIRV